MYGISWANILGTGLRADARYTRFDSTFGKGNYEMISLSREMTERLRLEAQVGAADFQSAFTQNGRSRFGTAELSIGSFVRTIGWAPGGRSIAVAHKTMTRSFLNLGYRF